MNNHNQKKKNKYKKMLLNKIKLQKKYEFLLQDKKMT